MSMSNEYILDRIDDAVRFNTSNKQVCNDALCLARGRIQSLRKEIEVKIKLIKELQDKLQKYEETEKPEEKLERGDYVICKNKIKLIKELQDKLQKYEEVEKSEEAEAKLERGDYVICKNKYVKTFEALYLGADYERYIVIDKDYETPHSLNINDWTLTKTGRHIQLFDIDDKEN